MKTKRKLGKIITFYSFKGGVGRTMAVANVAVLLAKRHARVLMIDWDLEAPGLERYFDEYLSEADIQKKGLIEFLLAAQKELPKMDFEDEDEELLSAFFENLNDYITPVRKNAKWKGELSLLRAGNLASSDYSGKLMKFGWTRFFNKIPGFFPLFAFYLKAKYDYVLIDSRTGHSDAGGVCTMLMPDMLALPFIPNKQNLDGVLALAEKAVKYRTDSSDLRPLSIFPLACRIEVNEHLEREEWAAIYTKAFENALRKIYNLPDISLQRYFYTPIIQFTYYAFGEKIAVLDEKIKDGISLSAAYSAFVDKLLSTEDIWDIIVQDHLESKAFRPKVVQIFAKADEKAEAELSKYLKPIRDIKTEWDNIILYPDYIDIQNFNKNVSLIKNADILILLLSSDVISSEILDQLKEQFGRFSKERKIAVVLRPCLWDLVIEKDQYSLFPLDGIPITSFDNLDATFAEIARFINTTVDSLTNTSKLHPPA